MSSKERGKKKVFFFEKKISRAALSKKDRTLVPGVGRHGLEHFRNGSLSKHLLRLKNFFEKKKCISEIRNSAAH
jgi:hypothetical protein